MRFVVLAWRAFVSPLQEQLMRKRGIHETTSHGRRAPLAPSPDVSASRKNSNNFSKTKYKEAIK
jgi:hypothetical protein